MNPPANEPSVTSSGFLLVASIIALVGVSGSARAQSTVRTHYGIGSSGALGGAIARAGDLDGDGVPDYWISDPVQGGTTNPVVVAYSGVSGVSIQQIGFQTSVTAFGSYLEAGRDLDGDQVPDVLVSAILGTPTGSGTADYGSVYVYSGSTGALIRHHSVGLAFDAFGSRARFIGDVTGDLVSEYAIASSFFHLPGTFANVRVFNGATGAQLYMVSSNNTGDRYGAEIESVDDLTGDGIPDFVVSAPSASFLGLTLNGAIYGYSGLSGFQFVVRFGGSSFEKLGVAVSAVGDVDGDGFSDIAATNAAGIVAMSMKSGAVLGNIPGPPGFAPTEYSMGLDLDTTDDVDGDSWPDILFTLWTNAPALSSALVVASLRTGEYLYTRQDVFHAPPFQLSDFPGRLLTIGDVDGDRRSEWLISDPTIKSVSQGFGGWAEVLSYRPLYATQTIVSPSQGLLFEMQLNAGLACAGMPYLVLGSMTGKSGLPIGQQVLPLSYDAVTDLTIQLANTQLFQNTFGTAGSGGVSAIAKFDAGFIPPIANGITLWFAYVALRTSGAYFVSNEVAVTFNAFG